MQVKDIIQEEEKILHRLSGLCPEIMKALETVFFRNLWKLNKIWTKRKGSLASLPTPQYAIPTPSGYCKNRLRKNTFLRPQVLPSIVRDLTVEKFTFFYYPVKEKQEVYAYRQAHGLTSET